MSRGAGMRREFRGPLPLTILLLLPLLTACRASGGGEAGDPRGAQVVHEFVAAGPDDQEEAAFCAAGGRALRLDRGHPRTPVIVLDRTEAGTHLWLRASAWREAGGKAAIALRLVAGSREIPFQLQETGQRDRFEWTAVSLRGLPAQRQSAMIELAPDASGGIGGPGESGGTGGLGGPDTSHPPTTPTDRAHPLVVELDQWAITTDEAAPPASASPPVWRDGDLEVRAAEGAHVFDPEWVLHLLREQRDAVATLLGLPATGLVTLVAIPASRWPDEAGGAFQSGCAIYLRDDELHLPWRSFAHELAHVFEVQSGVELPRFLSEGMACRVATLVDRKLWERGVDGEARDDRLLEELDPSASAALIAWSKGVDAARTAPLYRNAEALCLAAERIAGRDLWARLHAALRQVPVRLESAPELLAEVGGAQVRALLVRQGVLLDGSD